MARKHERDMDVALAPPAALRGAREPATMRDVSARYESDAALIRRIGAGDRDAFERL